MRILKQCFSLLVTLVFSLSVFTQTVDTDKELRTLATLLAYISKDYSEAVSEGKIINEFEFAEMSEFSTKCISLHAALSPSITNSKFHTLDSTLLVLKQLITDTSSVSAVRAHATVIKNAIFDLGLLSLTPVSYPSLKNGAILYQNNCVACHGEKGLGDGPTGQGLNPLPSNLTETTFSPLEAYNVIKLGIEGTAMASYSYLSEKEIWDLSFYVLSLKNRQESRLAHLPNGLNLDSISIWNDEQLSSYILQSQHDFSVSDVRNFEPQQKSPLSITLSYHEESYSAYMNNDYQLAEEHAFSSYLEGFELIENMLKASSEELMLTIEKNMIGYRKAIQDRNDNEVEKYYALIKEDIVAAQTVLETNDFSFSFTFGSALSILIREAIESVIIILIVLSVLKSMNASSAIKYVHLGWITSIALGILGWFFVDILINMSGASREVMEGAGALIAVVVLILAGVWLHSNSEVAKWTKFVKEKVKNVTSSGSQLGLFFFSFVVVFREVIEVVLFLSALKLNNPEKAENAILWAIAASIIFILLFIFIFLKASKRLPLNKFFKVAAYMVMVLAVILSGKGIMAIQEAGYIPLTPVEFIPQIDLLGIFPNLQAIGGQLITLAIILFFNWRNKRGIRR